MRIETNLDKCVICLSQPPDSREHIIPVILGGQLQAKILCTKCNSDLGSSLVSSVKKAVTIRFAIEHLHKDIPEIYEAIIEGQEYVIKNIKGDSVEAIIKNGDIWVKGRQLEDGSLIMDTSEAKKSINKMLERSSHSNEERNALLSNFDDIPENIIVPVTDEISVVKWSFEKIQPKLSEPFIDKRAATLMAYEFLALCIGDWIYLDRFDPIRNFIRTGEPTSLIEVNYGSTHEHQAIHGFHICGEEKEIVVTICLFGALRSFVHFKGFRYCGDHWIFTFDLLNKRVLVHKSPEEAKKGICYVFPQQS
jgi:hypothetical protein